MASLAGAWTALVGGFGGLRDDEGILSSIRSCQTVSAALLQVDVAGYRLTVSATHDDVTYTLRDGPDGELKIRHAGEELTLNTTEPTTVPLQERQPLLPHRRSRQAASRYTGAAAPSESSGQPVELICSIYRFGPAARRCGEGQTLRRFGIISISCEVLQEVWPKAKPSRSRRLPQAAVHGHPPQPVVT